MAVINGGDAGELGASLRKLRNRAHMSTRQLGIALNLSSANVSLWERGERLPSEERVVQVLDALNIVGDERAAVLGLRQRVASAGQLSPGAPSIGDQLEQLVKYEQDAEEITDVAPLLVPGLLQTEDYARATLGQLPNLDTRVTLRVGRSRILTRARNPVRLLALIDSEVLVRRITSPAVMADQLKYLLAMGERDNIDICIVPSTTAGFTPLLAGPFILIKGPTTVVHLEHHRASAFLWDQADVDEFALAAEEIHTRAMTPARTAEVIAEIVNGMEST